MAKMKSPYDIRFPTLIQIIYQREKICYFNHRNVITMMKANKGEQVDWVKIMQLVKELHIWTKF